MPVIELTSEATGYPDGITLTRYEPGLHYIPEPLASCFERLGLGVYVHEDDEDVIAPQEPATAPQTSDGDGDTGEASQDVTVPPTAPDPPSDNPAPATKARRAKK